MKKQKILIVDDDTAHIDSARGILEAEGYEVFTHDRASGSTSAIVAIRPDLVLVGVNEPELSGETLADVYRTNVRTRTARVMLYSHDEDALRNASKRLQLDGYVCKGDASSLRLEVAIVLAR